MPTYVFECLNKKCKCIYEDLVSYDPKGKYLGLKCPYCKSCRKRQLPTGCGSVIFTNPRGTSKADNFSYVAGYNMEQAKGERRKAEQDSHMGATPYSSIDDISGGKYFGEVK